MLNQEILTEGKKQVKKQLAPIAEMITDPMNISPMATLPLQMMLDTPTEVPTSDADTKYDQLPIKTLNDAEIKKNALDKLRLK